MTRSLFDVLAEALAERARDVVRDEAVRSLRVALNTRQRRALLDLLATAHDGACEVCGGVAFLEGHDAAGVLWSCTTCGKVTRE